MDSVVDLVQSLKALADERRMQIIHLLLEGDLCVGALAQSLGISKPAVSQHLKVLRNAGLVWGEKRGYWTHYAVNADALNRVSKGLSGLLATPRAKGRVEKPKHCSSSAQPVSDLFKKIV
jgi:DNA-binding transcriptional ArsR family regulator